MCEACDTMMNFNPYDEGFEAGQLAEQNRIIALLETKSSEFAESHDWADVELLTYVISLIKEDVAERRQTQMSEYGDKGENE